MTIKNEYQSICQFLGEAAANHPDKPAVVTDGKTLCYQELMRRAAQAAQLLSHAPGDNPRVALLSDNSASYVILYWAILLSGGVTVELNPGLGIEALENQLKRANPRLLIADESCEKLLSSLGFKIDNAKLPIKIFDGTTNVDEDLSIRLTDALYGNDPHEIAYKYACPPHDAIASIIFTSGTTGETKGACLTHYNLAWATPSIAASFGFTRDDNECFSGNLPLFYTYGKSVLHLATYLAAPIVFTQRFLSPESLLDLIAANKATHLSLVPYLCSLLIKSHRFTAKELPSLRRFTVSGGSLSKDLHAELLRRFPGGLIPMFGLTEASTRVACMPSGEAKNRPSSCGRPIPGVEVDIADEGGRSLDPLEVGEIRVRAPSIMKGYFLDESTTRAAIRDGWLYTGDLGFLDQDGYLYISGRLKDMIKVMGESVSAISIEDAIAKLPGVAEAAVKGVPHPILGEAICAFVVLELGVEMHADVIRRHCAQTLGRVRTPTHIEYVAELPKTASQKVRKHLLVLNRND